MRVAINFVSWILIISLVFGNAIPHSYARAEADSTASHAGAPASGNSFHNAISTVLTDPFLEELEQNPTAQFQSIEEVVGPIGADDFDENPFYLRGQIWRAPTGEETAQISTTAQTNEEIFLTQDHARNRTFLIYPRPNKVLEIPGLFSALFESDEFLFLNPTSVQEGVFFISKTELQKAERQRTTVPLFFLPVPGLDTSEVAINELPEIERFIFRWKKNPARPEAEDPVFSIPVADLHQLAKAEDLNLKLALVSRFVSADRLPAPRSTAWNGLVYTGPEVLERSVSQSSTSNSLIQILKNFALPTAFAQDPRVTMQRQSRGLPEGIHSRLIRFAVICAIATVSAVILKHTRYKAVFKKRNEAEEARYLASCEGALSQGSSAAVATVGTSGGAAESSESGEASSSSADNISDTVVRSSEPSPYTRTSDDSIVSDVAGSIDMGTVRPSTPSGKKGIWKNITSFLKQKLVDPVYKFKPVRVVHREVRDTLTVTSTVLWTLWGIPTVWAANAIEFLGDRYAPRFFSGERSRLRRLLSKTLYWSRAAVDNITPTAYTWMMGLSYGSVDTASYYIQLYSVNEGIARELAEHFPVIQPRVDRAFGSDNESLEQNRVAEIAKCGIFYGNSGAALFSQAWRAQLLQTAQAEVGDAMRAQGKDPFDPHFQGEYEQLVEKRLSAIMKEQDLPSLEDFLFDASTYFEELMRTLGYRLPKDFIPSADATYWGTSRPGLVESALGKALDHANLKLEDESNTVMEWRAKRAAVQLFSHIDDNLQISHHLLGRPMEILKNKSLTLRQKISSLKQGILESVPRIRRMRQDLLFLTVSKDEHLVEHLARHAAPQEWVDLLVNQGFTEDEAKAGIDLTTKYFRNSMVALMTGDDTQLGATRRMRDRYGKRAQAITKREFLSEHAEEFAALRNQGLSEESAFLDLRMKNFSQFNAATEDNIITLAQDNYALSTNRIYDGYRPPHYGTFAKWQLRRAEQRAQARFIAETGREFDPSHLSDDQEAPTAPNTRYSNEARKDEARAQWIFAESLMSVIGLHPQWSLDPALEERVLRASLQNISDLRKTDPHYDEYLSQLTPWERAKLKREIFADFVVRNYLAMTAADPNFPALSPNQPGRFQRFRQVSWVKNSQVLTRTLRAAEAIVGPTSFGLGFKSMLDRNIPMLYYFKASNGRSWRGSVVSSIAITPFNYLLYGVWVAPYIWTWNLLTRFLVGGPEQAINMLFRMQGLRPMSSLPTMLLYSAVFAWGTFWGTIPTQIFQEDFAKLWRTFDRFHATRTE